MAAAFVILWDPRPVLGQVEEVSENLTERSERVVRYSCEFVTVERVSLKV